MSEYIDPVCTTAIRLDNKRNYVRFYKFLCHIFSEKEVRSNSQFFNRSVWYNRMLLGLLLACYFRDRLSVQWTAEARLKWGCWLQIPPPSRVSSLSYMNVGHQATVKHAALYLHCLLSEGKLYFCITVWNYSGFKMCISNIQKYSKCYLDFLLFKEDWIFFPSAGGGGGEHYTCIFYLLLCIKIIKN